MLTLTQVQTPSADLHPDDAVLYRLHDSVAAPPLFEPGPDYEPVSPAVIVAFYPSQCGGRSPYVFMPMWARVFRLRPEVQAAREKAAEEEARRQVARALFPGLNDAEWRVVDLGQQGTAWRAIHEAMGITLDVDGSGWLGCRWGALESELVIAQRTATGLRQRIVDALTAYLAHKRTREGTSARIVERRNRARALLAAMGVVDTDAGEG